MRAFLVVKVDRPAQQLRLNLLLDERALIKFRYDCDVFHFDVHEADRRQYWTKTFSNNRDDTPKGIFTLTLQPLPA